jgi:hypothetical protein
MFSFLLAGDRSEFSDKRNYALPIEKIINDLSSFSTVVLLSNDKKLEQLERSCKKLIFQLVPNETPGALITAAYGLSKVGHDQPFLIVPSNSILSDNLIESFSSSMTSKAAEVGTIVFQGVNPLYSYARLGKMNNVIEFIEKEVDGSCALAGVHYFKDKILFENCLRWALVNNVRVKGNFFISSALNYFLANAIELELFSVSAGDYTRFD